jgi:type IV pilus assembly protein PilY1
MIRFITHRVHRKLDTLLYSLLLISMSAAGQFAAAAPLALSTNPLDVAQGVPPNILLTLDTSGSMSNFFLPDTDYTDGDRGDYLRDADYHYNYLYFNPNITYNPPVDADGVSLGNASFSAAWPDGFNKTLCANNAVNLGTSYFLAWTGGGQYSPDQSCTTGSQAAFYATQNNNANCSYPTTDDTCYDKNTIPAADQQNFANWYSYYRSRLLMAKTTASQAFATLPRNVRVTRQTLGDTSIPAVKIFDDISPTTDRTDFFTWLKNLTASGSTPMRQAFVRAGNFFSKPLGNAKDPYVTTPGVAQSGPEYSCRQNFNILITDGQWNDDTAFSPDPGNNYDNTAVNLPSSTLGFTTSPYTYTPQLPYADGYTPGSGDPTTLADIAFYFWVHDLRSDLADNVPMYIRDTTTDYNNDGHVDDTDTFLNPLNDPATWHHMVNFTIPLGLTGELVYHDNYYQSPFTDPANQALSYTKWPEVTSVGSSEAAKVDDLWHAAINSRGGFYPASDPKTLVDSLSSVLNSVSQRTGTASALTVSTATYQTSTNVYQTQYTSTDWHGDLVAYSISNLSTPLWSANSLLNTQLATSADAANRIVITYKPTGVGVGTGVPFEWASLSSAQQSLLSLDQVNYLRGDNSKVSSQGGSFRNRTNMLGDIVDSTPTYVGPPDRFFPDSLESAPYSSFKSTYSGRKNMVYVGANDGMLHAFDAATGAEKFAYIPSSVYGNLANLTSPGYGHSFYVDGTATSRDAFFGGAWHTVLVGGLNHGGQGIYALDITDPSSFSSETTAAAKVLWEFTDANDADLGYTYSQPTVAKMNSTTSQWAAIFGNGYNNTVSDSYASSTGDAVLYIVDIKTGTLLKKFDTGVGTTQDPLGQGRPNGLATVGVADINGDYTVDYIYAGDLFGNLWKFDVSDPDPTNWTITQYQGKNAPLFTATDASGNAQPITTAPVISANAYASGIIVNFGTGAFLQSSDLTDTSEQTFYGVWDRNNSTNAPTITRANLLAQTILATNTTQFATTNARVTSSTTLNWYQGSGLPPTPTGSVTDSYLGWYLDLQDSTSATPALGERVINTPIVFSNHLIFISSIPTTADPCLASGSSWIYELNASNGLPFPTSVFDYNNDKNLGVGDLVHYNSKDVVGSGIQFQNEGRLTGLTLLSNGTSTLGAKPGQSGSSSCLGLSSSSSGKTNTINLQCYGTTGRRSWTQLLH